MLVSNKTTQMGMPTQNEKDNHCYQLTAYLIVSNIQGKIFITIVFSIKCLYNEQ